MLNEVETDLIHIRYCPRSEECEVSYWTIYLVTQPGNYMKFDSETIREMKSYAKRWAGDHLAEIVAAVTDGMQVKLE